MIVTPQICPCPFCNAEIELEAMECHACRQVLRCARAQVLEVPAPGALKKLKSVEKPQVAKVVVPEKSVIKRCLAKLQARKYDISTLHFE